MMTGYDGYAELGDGGVTGDGSRFSPELVPGLSGVVSASTSYYDTLALLSNGTVEGWGYNRFGELGDGTNEEQTTPEQISGLSEVTAIAAGYYHSLALLANGTVEAWGYNHFAELGDGTTEERLSPEQVPGLSERRRDLGGLLRQLRAARERHSRGVGREQTRRTGRRHDQTAQKPPSRSRACRTSWRSPPDATTRSRCWRMARSWVGVQPIRRTRRQDHSGTAHAGADPGPVENVVAISAGGAVRARAARERHGRGVGGQPTSVNSATGAPPNS